MNWPRTRNSQTNLGTASCPSSVVSISRHPRRRHARMNGSRPKTWSVRLQASNPSRPPNHKKRHIRHFHLHNFQERCVFIVATRHARYQGVLTTRDVCVGYRSICNWNRVNISSSLLRGSGARSASGNKRCVSQIDSSLWEHPCDACTAN